MKKLFIILMTFALIMTFLTKTDKVYASENVPTIKKVECETSRIYEGKSQILNISSKGQGNVQYRVWLFDNKYNRWQEITNGYTAPINIEKKFTITTPKLKIGENKFSIWIKRENKKTLNEKGYDNYYIYKVNCSKYDGQVYDKKSDNTKKSNSNGIPHIEKVFCELPYIYEGDSQTFDIFAKGFENIQYRVWLFNKNTSQWSEATNGYTKPSYAQNISKVTTPKLLEGNYKVSIWIKRADKKPLNEKGYDDLITFNITCLKNNLTNHFNINTEELYDLKNNYELDEKIELKSKNNEKQYRYGVYDALNNKQIVNIGEFNTNLSWKPTKEGIYIVQINCKTSKEIENSSKYEAANSSIELENIFKDIEYSKQSFSSDKSFWINKLIVVGNPYKKSTGKIVYLTFDDGPSTQVTTKILKVLDKYDVKATFFVVGQFVDYNKNLLKKIYEKGHAIGNHTYSHNYNYLYSSTDNLLDEIQKTDKLIKSLIPNYNTKLFRFPGGSYGRSQSFIDAVQNAGYDYYNWNASNGDTTAYLVPAEKLISNIKKTCSNKKQLIILMHDAPVKTTTADALPAIIEYLINEGYEFRTLE